MKNLILMLAASVALSVTACAQVKVPDAVKSSFNKEYPGTKVKWEKEGANYEAGFEQMGHEMSVIYSSNGTSLEKEMEIKVSELPKVVTDNVMKMHKGAKIKEAAKITKANGEVQYEAEVNGKDMLFTEAGKFIKEAAGD
ncbi:PepSY-like domain-containing protein [Pedobacter sp. SD-b]|uniref:PepSY-like domain-containing protein n=1 Tax=Pedobacter segetis TaxID=2793069 RepID=A0ABS1BK07_9SPHI|nr:PepSY-like domain-containing protein [Pedobacter segetis]MBK0383191.1 PepSY-like domain-containing protein [Pedobacter segetis]